MLIDSDVETWLDEAMNKAPMKEAPITHQIARISRSLKMSHQDPVDRFLAATAIALDLTLISADDRMLHSRQFSALPNK